MSHVTISGAAWREAVEGVICNGVCGLEGTGLTPVMDLGYSDSGCLILGFWEFCDFSSLDLGFCDICLVWLLGSMDFELMDLWIFDFAIMGLLKDVIYYLLLGIGGVR